MRGQLFSTINPRLPYPHPLTLHIPGVGDVVSVYDIPYHHHGNPATADTKVGDACRLAREISILTLEDGELRCPHVLFHVSL